MSLSQYLPSAKFTVMVGSIALSGGLVVAAQYITHAPPSTAQLATNQEEAAQAAQAAQWQQALAAVQAQSGVTAPQAPDPQTVSTLLNAAESGNLTTQVGRTLLINLSSASAQGLGSDAPTQDQLVAQATSQINAAASSTAYSSADLQIVPQNNASLHTYGNAVMAALINHPDANAQNTYTAVGTANDTQSTAALAELKTIGAAYRALTNDLVDVPVPQTFEPLQLQLVNDFAAMAGTYADMQTMLTDPLRGLAGVQRFASFVSEAQRVLTSIAQQLNKNGILFSKDEPGATWNAFLSS